MKLFTTAFVALIMLSTGVASAAYKIGTQTTYKITVQRPTGVSVGDATLEVIAYDATAKSYTYRYTVNIDGSASMGEAQMEASGVEIGADAVKNCAFYQGKAEKIKVVAGEFSTCFFKGDAAAGEADTWIGDAPFAMVKQISVDGIETTTTELASVKIAN